MISQRTSGLNAILALCQLVLSLGLFWTEAILLLIVFGKGLLDWDYYALYAAVILLGLVLEMLSGRRWESGTAHHDFISSQKMAARQILFSGGLLLIYLFATKDAVISRVFVASFLPSLYVMLLLTNRFLPGVLGCMLYHEGRWEKTLLVGRVRRAETLKSWLERKTNVGFRVVGILCDDDPWGIEPCSFSRLGGTHEIVDVVRDYGVTQVIHTEMPATPDEQHFIMEACDQLGVRLLVVSNLPERWGRPMTFIDDDGQRFIGLREDALENPLNQLIKRSLDIAISLPVIALVLPVTTAVVWFCQRRQSPGPVFFRQKRAGLQNREFEILKYRTMHVTGGLEAKQATKNDDRIYPAGRIFRKLSIDELPQFLNVFFGHMSVVGPRPHLLQHNELFARKLIHYQVRTFVKPGITGLAQVRGLRGEAHTAEDIARRIAADIEYLENWRPALDISIILQTVFQVLRPPKTAY